MLEIDGSTSEGGGQILRVALALASVLKTPLKISSIRANRRNPGLQAQHLAGVRILQKICNAKVEGAELHSTQLSFEPNNIAGGVYSFDVGTAGAVSLVLQAVLPVLAFAPRKTSITLTGGTHVNWSPTIDYIENVFKPLVARTGFDFDLSVEKYGFYPKGGGRVVVEATPARELNGITLVGKGELLGVNGISVAGSLPEHVAKRQREGVSSVFSSAEVRLVNAETACPGTAVTLWAEFENGLLGASALGEKGKPAEQVGREAGELLKKELSSSACVDVHAADQLMVFAALAKGDTVYRTSEVSSHAKTNAWLIEKICGSKIVLNEGEKTISIKGLGIEGLEK
ncbi:RNA 3'-phosphate cyclase [Candidatus Micrarchaeota archaeon]|nr:RNA 3'-phosphate cyclase [Candidatus Micrarchaeota archaeon]